MPKSPGVAAIDFGVWGILKRRLQKRYVNSFLGYINKLEKMNGINLTRKQITKL